MPGLLQEAHTEDVVQVGALAGTTTRTGTRVPRAAALLAAAATVAALAPAPPATAAGATIRDTGGTGDSKVGDFGELGAVRAHHGENRLTVRIPLPEGTYLPDFYNVYVDTDSDPRPEYVVVVDAVSSGDAQVRRVDFWQKGRRGAYPSPKRVTCPDVPARIADTGPRGARGGETTVVSLARRCVGSPDRLRVTTRSVMEYQVADWAPAFRSFGPTLRRG